MREIDQLYLYRKQVCVKTIQLIRSQTVYSANLQNQGCEFSLSLESGLCHFVTLLNNALCWHNKPPIIPKAMPVDCARL
jgi:hypothetical protein